MFQTAEIPFASTFPRRIFDMRRAIRSLLRNREAQVVTLRVVLGFGWLMAGVEKLSSPAWHNGEALTLFLQNQLAVNAVYLPFYEMLITEQFLPNAATLSWCIMMGEWLVGLALITGTLTNIALFFGVLMNINYGMAGVIDPTILYIVIQGILYSSNAGAYFSLDSVLPGYLRRAFGIGRQNFYAGSYQWKKPKWYRRMWKKSNREPESNNRTDSKSSSANKPDQDIFMGGRMKDSDLRNKA